MRCVVPMRAGQSGQALREVPQSDLQSCFHGPELGLCSHSRGHLCYGQSLAFATMAHVAGAVRHVIICCQSREYGDNRTVVLISIDCIPLWERCAGRGVCAGVKRCVRSRAVGDGEGV